MRKCRFTLLSFFYFICFNFTTYDFIKYTDTCNWRQRDMKTLGRCLLAGRCLNVKCTVPARETPDMDFTLNRCLCLCTCLKAKSIFAFLSSRLRMRADICEQEISKIHFSSLFSHVTSHNTPLLHPRLNALFDQLFLFYCI